MKQPSNGENHPRAAHPLDEPLTKHRFTSNMVVAYDGILTLQYWESSAPWHESSPLKGVAQCRTMPKSIPAII